MMIPLKRINTLASLRLTELARDLIDKTVGRQGQNYVQPEIDYNSKYVRGYTMWVLVPQGQALKVDGGAALVWVVPMDQVAILPTVSTPAPVSQAQPAAQPAAIHPQPGPTLVQSGSPVTVQLIPSP